MRLPWVRHEPHRCPTNTEQRETDFQVKIPVHGRKKTPMNREAILNHLRDHRAEIGERFAVERLGLFGSAARDELAEDSATWTCWWRSAMGPASRPIWGSSGTWNSWSAGAWTW